MKRVMRLILMSLVVIATFMGSFSAAQNRAVIGVEVSHGWTANPGSVKDLAQAVEGVVAEDWIADVRTYRHDCSVPGSDCDTVYTGIEAQARAMSSALAAELRKGGKFEGINAFALVGHSQGTLRNRAALQFRYLDPYLRDRTIALINVGSPGAGAPIIINGLQFWGLIESNLFLTTYGVWTLIKGLGMLFSYDFRKALFLVGGTTPSKRDMSPGSAFITKLNQDKATKCRYVRKSVWVGWLWWRHKVYRWVRVCKRVQADNRIPRHVAVLDIAGTNNKFSAMMPDVYKTIHGLGFPLSVAAIGFWSMAWEIWPIPIAIGLTNLSFIMLTFDYQWQGVVGSKYGDATVTLSSQLALKDRKYLLEDPNLYSYRKIHITHADEPYDYRVFDAIQDFFDASNNRGPYKGFEQIVRR